MLLIPPYESQKQSRETRDEQVSFSFCLETFPGELFLNCIPAHANSHSLWQNSAGMHSFQLRSQPVTVFNMSALGLSPSRILAMSAIATARQKPSFSRDLRELPTPHHDDCCADLAMVNAAAHVLPTTPTPSFDSTLIYHHHLCNFKLYMEYVHHNSFY